MQALLITLTVIEIALVLGAVAVYLVLIDRSLRTTATYLSKVTFGVRAIESQCAPIGPAVTRINKQLADIAAGLGGLGRLAGQLTDGRRSSG